MILHSPTISGSLTFADGGTFTLPDNGVYSGSFSGSIQVHQAISSILPSVTNTFDLGSPEKQWRDIYLSSASLYIDGTPVLQSNNSELIISTDVNQSLKLVETGADTITLQTENGDITFATTGNGNIELDAPIQIAAGNKILSSDGNNIHFGNGLSVTGSISLSGNVDGVDVATLKSSFDTLNSKSLVSGSSQVDVTATTGYSAISSHISSTSNPHSVTKAQVGLGSVDNTSDLDKPVSTATQTALNAKLNINGAGVVSVSSQVDVTATANYSTISSHISDTSNPHSVTKSQVGLGNVDNTSDLDKPISTATQDALDLKATVSALNTQAGRIDAILASSTADADTFAEIVSLINSVDTTNDSAFAGFVTSSNAAQAVQDDRLSALESTSGSLLSSLDSHISDTDNPHSVTKAQVGLGNVDNTSDANKPVSTAQQTALNLKADSTTLSAHVGDTNNPHSVTKAQVGLGNVDNTSDLDKPVSTAQQTALNAKLNINGAGVVSGSSQVSYPSLSNIPSGIVSGSSQVLGGSGIVSSSAQIDSLGFLKVGGDGVISGSSQVSFSSIVDKPTLISGSSQVDHDSTTNFVANKHIDHSTVSVTAGAGLTGGGDITISRTLNVVSANDAILVNANDIQFVNTSVTLRDGIKTKLNLDGVLSGSTQVQAGSISGDIALGAQTSGNYVASLVAGTNITLSNNSGEGATPTIGLTNNSITISGTSVSLGGSITDAVLFGGTNLISGSTQILSEVSIDEDAMTSNSATKLPTQQSVKAYVDSKVAGLVDSAPGALDTLNELALALGDDANFSTTVTTSISTKANSSVQIIAGAGLTGGGDLTASRTLNIGAGTGVTVAADSISIGQPVGTGDTVQFAKLGVGGAADATYELKVTGDIGATGDIVAYVSSDERLKNNIELISNPIEKVQSLRGVTWEWNELASDAAKQSPNLGVIAQEVEKVLPQLVHDRESGFKGVDYSKLTGLLIEAIKEQQKQIDELKSKLG